MRLLLKLSAAVALAVAMQRVSLSVVGYLDELQFTARVFCADAAGVPPDCPDLLDAAYRLTERQRARMSPTSQPPSESAAYAWQLRRDWRVDPADSS